MDRPVQDEGRHHASKPQSGDKGRRLPVPVRHTDPQPLAPRGPTVAARHVGGGPGLVDEHEALRLKIELPLEPGSTPLQDIRPVLFGGVRRLFLRVMLWRPQKRQSAATLS